MFLYHEDDAILIEFCHPNREPIELKVINPGTTFLFLISFSDVVENKSLPFQFLFQTPN